MKNLVSILLLLAGTSLGLAQGKVTFANDSQHLVCYTTDTSRLAPGDVGLAGQPVQTSANLFVDLFAGTSASALAKVATTTFSSPGLFNGGTVSLPFPGGTTEYFQVTAYYGPVGSYAAAEAETEVYYGESAVFTCTPGTLNPVPLTTNWQPLPPAGSDVGFYVQLNPVPEPSMLALAGLGLGLLAARRVNHGLHG